MCASFLLEAFWFKYQHELFAQANNFKNKTTIINQSTIQALKKCIKKRLIIAQFATHSSNLMWTRYSCSVKSPWQLSVCCWAFGRPTSILGPVLIDAPKQQQGIMGFVVLAVNAPHTQIRRELYRRRHLACRHDCAPAECDRLSLAGGP